MFGGKGLLILTKKCKTADFN